MGLPAEEKTAFLMSVLNTLDTSALDWNAIAAKNNITTNAAKKRWKRYKDSVEGKGGKATKASDESDGGSAEGEKTPKKRKRAPTTTPKKKAVAANVNRDGAADE